MKKYISLFLALSLCLGLTAPAALAAESPAVSSNIEQQDQTSYSASTVKSYLFANEAGGLTRVEYTGNQIAVEDYSSDFAFQSSRTIPMELSIWGGFFAGADYNFFVFGQQNTSESDSAEVIRVVKYSKNWERLGQASLRGANTTTPFYFGSLRCAEYGGYLYIRTCHEMYTSDDGLNHQANMMLSLRQSDMEITDSFSGVVAGTGYVSHSFNQFVLIDGDGHLVALDHGDTYPRSAVLSKYNAEAGEGKFSGRVNTTNIQTFAKQTVYQITGASLGGLTETRGGYVAAYNYDSTGSGSPTDRTVYLAYVPKSGSSATTHAISSVGTTTPHLVSTGPDGGYILWNGKQDGTVTDTLYYASYDGTGNVGTVQTATGSLSDCAPIYYNGQVVWYVTNNSAPVFYTLNESGVTRHDGQIAQEQPQGTTQPGESGGTVLSAESLMTAMPGGYEGLYASWSVEFSQTPLTANENETEFVFPAGTIMYVPAVGHTDLRVNYRMDFPWMGAWQGDDYSEEFTATLESISAKNEAGETETVQIPGGGLWINMEPGINYTAHFTVSNESGEQITYQPTFRADASQNGAAGFETAYSWSGLRFSQKPLEDSDPYAPTFPDGTVIFIPPQNGIYTDSIGDRWVYMTSELYQNDGSGLSRGDLIAEGKSVNGIRFTLEGNSNYEVHFKQQSSIGEFWEGSYFFSVAAGSGEPTQPEKPDQSQETTFSDVPTTHWAHDYIEKAVAEGWVNGVGNNRFAPDKEISYAEFSTMLVRAYYEDELNAYAGSSDPWFMPYCTVAHDLRLYDGTNMGQSAFDAIAEISCNRYEMAQLLYNILNDQDAMPEYDAASIQAKIGDWSSITGKYKDAVAGVFAAGLIGGVDANGTFNGDGVMTRAQAATVMCRLAELIGD